MKRLPLAMLCVLLPLAAVAEELSDIDLRMIVELADGVYKGDVVSVEEIEHRDENGDPLPYRNARVIVSTADGSLGTFRASKIDGDWRLDEAEIKRLDYLQSLRARFRQSVTE